MAINAGTVQALTSADLGGFKTDMRKMRREGDRASKDVERDFDRMGRSIAGIAKTAGLAIGAAFVTVGGLAVKQAAEFETLRVSMNALNGSVEEGARNFERLKEFSAGTPFQLQDLAKSQNMLQGFGMAADDAFESMKMIGDIAAITGADINGIGIAFGQAAAEGRLMTRDIRQFINQGVPAIKLLADTMGVAQSEVLGLAEEGKISFDILQRSFRDATSAGGMFADGMKRQAEALSGGFSTLKDNTSILLGEFGDLIVESTGLNDIMRDLTGEVGNLTSQLESAEVPTSDLAEEFRGWYVILREFPGTLRRVNEQFSGLNSTITGIQTGGLSVLGEMLGDFVRGSVRDIGQADQFVSDFTDELEKYFEKMREVSDLNIDSGMDDIIKDAKEAKKASEELSFTNQEVLDSYNRLKPAIENVPPTAKIFDPSLPEEFNMSLNDIASGFNSLDEGSKLKEIKEDLEEGTGAGRFFAHTLADGFEDVLFQARSVEDAIKGIIRQFASRAFTTGLMGLFTGGFGAGGFFGSMFGGFRASGGPVSSGKSYVVGENGPEMFTPRTSGSIIPNSKMGGNRTLNLNLRVIGEFQDNGNTLKAVIKEQTRQIERLL